MRELRPYQVEACTAVRDAWEGGMLRPAIVMATGLGKSTVVGEIATKAAREGKRTLIVAHRDYLLDQLAEACQAMDPSIAVGQVQGQRRNETRRPITVAMTQTLARESRRARLPKPDLVIMDECHHAPSPSNMDILRWAGCFDDTPLLGVTATLSRGDKLALGDVFQGAGPVFKRDTLWAVENGWLTPPRGIAVVLDHMDLAKVKTRAGDFQEGQLGEMVRQDVDQIVKAWQEHASDRLTVAFVPSVSAAVDLCNEFLLAGIACEVVTGTTDRPTREGIYARLRAGITRVMIGVGVPTEGWDCPPISCVLMARPTKMSHLYQQMVGRGLRLHPGKVDCLVLDVVGASRKHKLQSLVQLQPSAEYDDMAIRALPCEVCGLPRAGDGLLCECPRELRESDGAPLLEDAEYEEVDLFERSPYNWLFTRAGLRFLGCGDRLAVLWPKTNRVGDDQTFDVGHCRANATLPEAADGRWIDYSGRHELHEARQMAERWASQHHPSAGHRLDVKTGGRRALVKDVTRWAAAIPSVHRGMTAQQLADAVDIHIASRLLDRVIA